MQAQSALLQCVLVSLTFLSAAQGQQARGSFPSGVDSQSSPDLETIIRNMEAAQEASRPQLPYEAVRDYRLLEGDAYLGEGQLNDRSCYKLRITPKRKDISLVDGEIWVDKGSFLIPRIEGEMSKTPSWWLKRVHLVLDFGNLGGTWQQTGTQALADVRMLGKRSLVSKVLDYREGEALALQRKPVALQGRGLPRRRARQAAFSVPMQ